jgi:site-specific recombinase XerD
MRETGDIFQHTLTLFLSDLSGKNRSSLTIRCYCINVSQFLSWIQENDLTVTHPAGVTKVHLSEYLSTLSDQGLSGRTRARKLAAIKEYFRFLVASGLIPLSPAESVSAPKRERSGWNFLTPWVVLTVLPCLVHGILPFVLLFGLVFGLLLSRLVMPWQDNKPFPINLVA